MNDLQIKSEMKSAQVIEKMIKIHEMVIEIREISNIIIKNISNLDDETIEFYQNILLSNKKMSEIEIKKVRVQQLERILKVLYEDI